MLSGYLGFTVDEPAWFIQVAFKIAEMERQASPLNQIPAIHDLKVEMGSKAISSISDIGDMRASQDFITNLDSQAAFLQVQVG